MKLLVMCSSYNYPEGLKKMYDSFLETKSKDTELVIYVSEEDPKIEEYKKLDIPIEFGIPKYMVDVANYFSEKYYADAYQLIHDDHIYLKSGWDNINKEITYFYDKDDSSKNPTAEIIKREVVTKLGYFIYPKFRQGKLEPFMKHLMSKVSTDNFGSEFIEHKCWHGLNKSEQNERHKFIYGEDYSFSDKILNEAISDVNGKI